jgi:hypothetical protein
MFGRLACFAALLFVLLATSAQAQSATASGTVIEYMPTSAVFRLSNTPAGCPLVAGGYWLQFSPSSTDEVKAAYAALLAAELSGHSVLLNVSGTTPSGMCNVTWTHAQ